ncbi:MAG: hypothetical protein ACLFSF_07360 [Desulfonatronovibrio sp.]
MEQVFQSLETEISACKKKFDLAMKMESWLHSSLEDEKSGEQDFCKR